MTLRIPSYDDLTPSIPDAAIEDVFASVKRLVPGPDTGSRPVAPAEAPGSYAPGAPLFACIRSPRLPELPARIAAEFSPRLQRYGTEAVVFDVSGLGRLLGPPETIGAEIVRGIVASNRLAGGRPSVAGSQAAQDQASAAPRSVSRYGLRIEAHPSEHGRICSAPVTRPSSRALGADAGHEPRPGAISGEETSALERAGVCVTVAPTQIAALLLSFGGSPLTVVTGDEAAALAPHPLRHLQQLLTVVHGAAVFRKPSRASSTVASARHAIWPFDAAQGRPFDGARGAAQGWPPWPACVQAFDVIRRWGLTTLGELAALPAADLSARMGQTGVALQALARGCDPYPLVPDPDVPRFLERLELEWPIDALEPLSFVLARLLEPLSGALERADRAAAAIRLDLRLVDRTTHARMLQLPTAIRDPRVLRTLLLLDLESHPPSAAIDVVTVEVDPAPGRVVQYSLLERATPSAETLATLTARLGALVGDARCGRPVLLDTHRPDAFAMQRFDAPAAARERGAVSVPANRAAVMPCMRRFRPPVAVRVRVERGRPAHVAIDRRGMPGGDVVQAAGPWRASGDWWTHDQPWNRDEWDLELSDGSVCCLFRDRERDTWFIDGVVD